MSQKLLAMVTAAVITLTGCGFPPIPHSSSIHHDSQSIDLAKTELTRAEVRMSAGKLNIQGGSPKLLEADFTYGDPSWKPNVRYSVTGSRGQLSVEQPGGIPSGNSGEYEWTLRFSNDQPLDLTTHFGAGHARMNLGSLALRNLGVHMGVGELELDLRGDPKSDYEVQVHGGVGKATIHLPKNVGIKATARGGIGDVEVRGLEKRDGRWVNPGQENAPVTIRVEVTGGVGQIRLLAE